VQSKVHITTNIGSLNPAHGEV